MTVPGIGDLSKMGFDDHLGIGQLPLVQSGSCGQMHFRRQPEFSFAVWVGDMDMDTGFFPGEEEQTELPGAENGRRHGGVSNPVVDITVCSFDKIFDEADHFFKFVALDEMGGWLSTRERF
jgi:hypothetical protein